MKILAIDTATSSLSAAIADRQQIVAQFALDLGKTHSTCFLPMLDSMLSYSGLKISDMDAIAVTVGPGSFTGLRIGVATAKAWGQLLGIPMIAVNSLEAMAEATGSDGLVCPIFDARRDEVYTALFDCHQRLLPDRAVAPQQLAEELVTYNKPVLMAGDGLKSYQQIFTDVLDDKLQLAAAPVRYVMAAAAAIIGQEKYARGEFTSLPLLQPVYLRLSEAEERKLALMQKAVADDE